MMRHRGVYIGWLERGSALASKIPFNATGTGNAVHLPAKLAFQEGIQGTSWKPKPLSIIAKRPEAATVAGDNA